MDRLHGRNRRFSIRLGLIVLALAGGTGCVTRRYTIRTDPPGALAIVNGQEIGITPVSASFTFYGDRDITLIRDGYQTVRIRQPIRPPWWDNLLTEFFSENVVPYNLRDEREFHYQLPTAFVPPTNELLSRGEALRSQGNVIPPPRRNWFRELFNF